MSLPASIESPSIFALRRPAAALLLALAPAAPARAGDAPQVHWHGSMLPLERVGAEAGEAAGRAVEAWKDWAVAKGYGLFLSEDGVVLLLIQSKEAERELALIERTSSTVAELLRGGAGAKAGGKRAKEAPAQPEIDADPFDLPPDSAVLVQAHDVNDYRAYLERAAELEPRLAGWIDSAAKLGGCSLTSPLSAAWIELLDGQEEWDIQNELVHRLANLLVLREYQQPPFWLQMGLAWYVESEIRGGIYCFPYRDEFVFATEHGSWGPELKRILKKGEEEYLPRIVAWRRGSYDSDCARISWGLARFLAKEGRGALPKILADMRELRREKGTTMEGRTWSFLPDWEPALEDQSAVLERHLGPKWSKQFVDASKRLRD